MGEICYQRLLSCRFLRRKLMMLRYSMNESLYPAVTSSLATLRRILRLTADQNCQQPNMYNVISSRAQ